MTFVPVLSVRPARDRLNQAAREPRKIAKAISKYRDPVLVARQRFGALSSVLVLTRIQLKPASSDLLGRPLFSRTRHDFHDDVEMIAHHRVAPDRHGEDVRRFANSILDPLPPMLVRASALPILSAKPCTTHTA